MDAYGHPTHGRIPHRWHDLTTTSDCSLRKLEVSATWREMGKGGRGERRTAVAP